MEGGRTIPKRGHVPYVANVGMVVSALEGTTNWKLLGDTGRAWGTKAPTTGWCSTLLMTGPASAEATARKKGFGGIIPENRAGGHGPQRDAIASVTGGTAEAAVGTGSRESGMNAIGDDEMEAASATSLTPRW